MMHPSRPRWRVPFQSMAWGGTLLLAFACSSGASDPSGNGGGTSTGGTSNGATGGTADGGTADGGTDPGTGGVTDGAGGVGSGGEMLGTGGDPAAGGSGGTGSGGEMLGTGGETTPIFGTEGDGRFEIGPNYTEDPDQNSNGAPEGQEFTFTMNSEDSAIYRGDDSTLNSPKSFTRQITVYIPDQYVDGTEAPILIHHDGTWNFNHVKRSLDNLTITDDPERRLPAFIAIAVENGGGDSKGSQRGLEYDTVSDRLARYIEEEVLPAVLANDEIRTAYPNLAFTSDPWGRATMGCSSGGAAAFTMAWFRPDLFRRVITYSGTFVDQQDDDAAEEEMYPLGAWDYHSGLELVANTDPKPLRVFLHASENDNNFGPVHNWLEANENMFEDLTAQGYHTRYLYAAGAGHCDGDVFEETVADSLVWAWRGYLE